MNDELLKQVSERVDEFNNKHNIKAVLLKNSIDGNAEFGINVIVNAENEKEIDKDIANLFTDLGIYNLFNVFVQDFDSPKNITYLFK